jgi:hypothetical protein
MIYDVLLTDIRLPAPSLVRVDEYQVEQCRKYLREKEGREPPVIKLFEPDARGYFTVREGSEWVRAALAEGFESILADIYEHDQTGAKA